MQLTHKGKVHILRVTHRGYTPSFLKYVQDHTGGLSIPSNIGIKGDYARHNILGDLHFKKGKYVTDVFTIHCAVPYILFITCNVPNKKRRKKSQALRFV